MFKKMIIVTDCLECPITSECKEYKKLTQEQKFYLKTSVGLTNAILKNCPLEDAPGSDYQRPDEDGAL